MHERGWDGEKMSKLVMEEEKEDREKGRQRKHLPSPSFRIHGGRCKLVLQ